MTDIIFRYLVRGAAAFIVLTLLAVCPAHAQLLPPPPSVPPSPFAPLQKLFGFLEQDRPGITDPYAPAIAPPVFRAETRFRFLFLLTSGSVTRTDTGEKHEFVSELGYPQDAMMTESMFRAQLSRISLRLHYDSYLRTLSGNSSRLDWPELRLGLDFDLIDREDFRFGGNFDFLPLAPQFSVSNNVFGAVAFATDRPITLGVHAAYNPVSLGTLSTSCEARWRISVVKDAGFNEVEVAAGIKMPMTMFGTMGVRGGLRYTTLSLTEGPFSVDMTWNAPFFDVLYLY